MTWRASYFDLASGLFVPQFVTSDPENGEFTIVELPEKPPGLLRPRLEALRPLEGLGKQGA